MSTSSRSGKKHFVDDVSTAVEDCLLGLVASSTGPRLQLVQGFPEIKVVVDADFCAKSPSERPVALISGGGSGHEPGQAGYVGEGMLAAAVCGDIFASPSAEAVYKAIKATCGEKGCLLIVMNYTGDRLNFGLAAERAKSEGLKVEMAIVGEDVALPEKKAVGRRGLAGTVLIHKLCGAAAKRGDSLSAIQALAQQASEEMLGTMGVSLTVCNIPGARAAEGEERIGADEMEVGLGIHGEPGRTKKKMQRASDIVAEVCNTIARPNGGNEYFSAAPGEPVLLLVNNLGASTPIEMNLLAAKSLAYCRESLQLQVRRMLVGSFKTSLDMHGMSITVMKLGSSEDSLLALIDEPTEAPGWPKSTGRAAGSLSPDQFLFQMEEEKGNTSSGDMTKEKEKEKGVLGLELNEEEQNVVRNCIAKACEEVIKVQESIDLLDAVIGDGDCGSSMKKGAEGILKDMQSHYNFAGGSSMVARDLAHSISSHMGGTSGAIYNIFFTAASTSLATASASATPPLSKYECFVKAFRAGVDAVQKYGGAQVGDRTLVDALYPFVNSLHPSLPEGSAKEDLEQALLVAEKSAEDTKQISEAALGRAAYVPEENLKNNPDPGAIVACKWIAGFVKTL